MDEGNRNAAMSHSNRAITIEGYILCDESNNIPAPRALFLLTAACESGPSQAKG